MKKLIFLSLLLPLSSCVKPPPEERIKAMEDWYLCQQLAQYAYGSHSQWLWLTTKEIKSRNLHNDPQCQSVYEARMSKYVRKKQRGLVITFGQAMNNSSFNEVTK